MEQTPQPAFVGIDVSKDRLDVAVHPGGDLFAVARDAAGLDELAARLKPLAPEVVALEATGGYETVVAATLATAGLSVAVLNPAQVRGFGRALGQRAKTDPIDARLIARFAATTRPAIRPLPDAATVRLADLVARRRQILAMMVAERQRRTRFPEQPMQRSIARLLDALQRELAEIDAEIDHDVRGSPAWREAEDLLASVPGVGTTIARTVAGSARNRTQGLNSAPSADARSRPWPALPPGPGSPAGGKAAPLSAAAAPRCAPPSIWARSPPAVTTQPSRPSATGSSPPESPKWSPSSPSRGSCSPFSTPSSGTSSHGASKPLDNQHSRSGAGRAGEAAPASGQKLMSLI
jgi:hypothetical protein